MNNCPHCQEELDSFDLEMEICPTCENNFDVEDVIDENNWENIEHESINGLDDEE